jgi:tetratricopeptide (TPR) repeat protein
MSEKPPIPNLDERAFLDNALQLARSGRIAEAELAFGNVLRRNPDSVEAHSFLATRAFQQQRYREAAAGYEKCVALQPGSSAFHFNLGTAREKLGDMTGAIDAYLNAYRLNPRASPPALFAGAALEAAGRRDAAVTMFSLGDDVDPTVRTAKDRADLDPEIRRRSALADRVMREHFTRLHAAAIDDFERGLLESGDGSARRDLSRVRRAIWTQTHDGRVQFRTPGQAPSLFYMPDLGARPVTPRELLPWAAQVEAKTAEVRDEYLAAVQSGAQMSPYVDPNTRSPIWRELRGRLDWSALHLFKAAQETPFAKLFPRTMKALDAADVVRIEGKPMELFFSRLKPSAHIPPHFGVANNRLTIHLPLIVPGDCAIRVGSETHCWREGELFAFDDSFEHEAWNRAAADRVVLIFESHHPDLRPEERAAIEFAFEARGRWLRERQIPQ